VDHEDRKTEKTLILRRCLLFIIDNGTAVEACKLQLYEAVTADDVTVHPTINEWT